MTLLVWSFVAVEGKTRKSGESSGRAGSDGSARLTNRATSFQPQLNYCTATPQKQHQKSHQKMVKRTTIKEGIKTLQPMLLLDDVLRQRSRPD
jgi:hypothetical protein